MEVKRKSLYVNADTLNRFKLYCVNNGYKMGFVIEKILKDWLDNMDKK